MQRRSDLITLLQKKNIDYIELSLKHSGSVIITPELGGRIMGVILGDQNLLRVNRNISEDWNSGGQRTWYAPEWGAKSIYAKGDETTWSVPEAMDPGKYRIIDHVEDEYVEMQNDFDVETTDKTRYSLSISRKLTVSNIKVPTEELSSNRLMNIEFEHKLMNRGDSSIEGKVGLWSILQVIPPGRVIVQLRDTCNGDFYSDEYYEKMPSERIGRVDNLAFIDVDGARRFKLGFPPYKTLGNIAYVSKLPDGTNYLIAKSFEISDDAFYVDKPYRDQRENGDAVQIYNHSEGGDMAFAELEAHAPASYLSPGDSQSFKIDMKFLTGSSEEIDMSFCKLFGTRMKY